MQTKPDVWYYVVNSERRGPVSLEDLQILVDTKKLSGKSLVWQPDFKEWAKIETVSALTLPAEKSHLETIKEEAPKSGMRLKAQAPKEATTSYPLSDAGPMIDPALGQPQAVAAPSPAKKNEQTGPEIKTQFKLPTEFWLFVFFIFWAALLYFFGRQQIDVAITFMALTMTPICYLIIRVRTWRMSPVWGLAGIVFPLADIGALFLYFRQLWISFIIVVGGLYFLFGPHFGKESLLVSATSKISLILDSAAHSIRFFQGPIKPEQDPKGDYYTSMGIPDLSIAWTKKEYQACAKGLINIANSDPEKLPLVSKGYGINFWRKITTMHKTQKGLVDRYELGSYSLMLDKMVDAYNKGLNAKVQYEREIINLNQYLLEINSKLYNTVRKELEMKKSNDTAVDKHLAAIENDLSALSFRIARTYIQTLITLRKVDVLSANARRGVLKAIINEYPKLQPDFKFDLRTRIKTNRQYETDSVMQGLYEKCSRL